MPQSPVQALESLIESLRRILRLDIHLRNPRHLSNENRSNPTGILPRRLAVALRVGLRAVADADEAAVGEPRVDFLDAGDFVVLCPLRERGDQAAEVLPAGVAENDGALRVVIVAEAFEEWVEVVGRGGEVEEGWEV